jgi:hypothetical protein
VVDYSPSSTDRPTDLADGLGRLHSNSTDSGIIIVLAPKNLEVSGLAPSIAPAVLDKPVLLAVLLAITGNQDTVVEIGSALGAVENTPGIELEHPGIGLDGDGDGSPADRLLEMVLVVGRHIDTVVDGDRGGTFDACPVLGGIGNILLGTHPGVDGVLKSGIHEPAITPVVSVVGGAPNKLLLGETDELTRLGEPSALHGPGGRERPATSTLTLVLDVGDRALVAPVDRIGEIGSLALEPLATSGSAVESGLGLIGRETAGVAGPADLGLAELVGGHIGKLVNADVVTLGNRIVVVDGVPIIGKLLEGGGNLLDGMIDLLVLGDEIEKLDDGAAVEDEGGGGEKPIDRGGGGGGGEEGDEG